MRPSNAATTSNRRLREVLVIAQVGLSVILLLSSGLLLRSLLSLLATSPGFETARVMKFGLGLPETRYDTEASLVAFHHRLLEDLEQLPGIEAVGAVMRLPLTGRSFTSTFLPEEETAIPAHRPRAAINLASPGYFSTLGIPLLEGRLFSWHDTPQSPRVILVNQAFSRTHLAGKPVLGRRLRLSWFSNLNPAETSWEVVGVVGDSHQANLALPPEPEIFLPMSQFPADGCSYLLRQSQHGSRIEAAVRAAVARLDPGLEQLRFEPLGRVVDRSLANRRLALSLLTALAATAVFLTMLSLYGVVAFQVAQSQRELAIRRSLGARRGQIAVLVLSRGLRLAAMGASVGAVGYLLLSRWIRSHLHRVGTLDPQTFLAATLLLVAITLLACAVPSMRAAGSSLRILIKEPNS